MIATKVDPDVAVKSAKKMTAGRTRIVFDRPLYSPILFKLDFKPAPWVPTMCTDGRSLMYNPKFSIDLTVDHLMFCILHETLHCVFRHCARRGNRDPPAGAILAVVLLIVAVSGGTLEQMWLWMIASAMAALIGVQLIVARVIMNVLDDLSQREIKQEQDLQGNPIKPASREEYQGEDRS